MTQWSEFKRRSLWQHPVWDEFQKAVGNKTWILKTDGAQALVIRHTMSFGLSWLEVPRGPLFTDEESLKAILKEIRKLAMREAAIFVRMSSYTEMRIEGFGLMDAKTDKHPQHSLILDLGLSEEEILDQMKQKGRYNIKLAEKHDVTVEHGGDLDSWYIMLQKTCSRDGFRIHPKEHYKKMLELLGDDTELIVAKYQDRMIAGGIFVYLDGWAIYYYGAADYNYRNLMAPYAVQWEAIKTAKMKGCSHYDFLGIAPDDSVDHLWAGVTSFKKKFGGKMVEYAKAREIVLKPFWYFIYGLRKSIR